MDPHYEDRATHSPTTARLSRQLQLQISASLGFKKRKGDVTGAFLQPREYPEELKCIPCLETCEAMGIPPGSMTKVKKACYGLVDVPLQWYRSISSFLSLVLGWQNVGQTLLLVSETRRTTPWCDHSSRRRFSIFGPQRRPHMATSGTSNPEGVQVERLGRRQFYTMWCRHRMSARWLVLSVTEELCGFQKARQTCTDR